jgi:hypothetical protein
MHNLKKSLKTPHGIISVKLTMNVKGVLGARIEPRKKAL